MNTQREDNHGEYWADEGIYIRFNMKKLWAWLVSLFLLSGIVHAQVSYCGVDVPLIAPTSGVAKQTLSNILIRSQELDVVAGYTISSGLTITADNASAPDGTTTAERLTADAANSVKRLAGTPGTNRPLSAGPGTRYRTSGYFKAGTHSFISISDGGDDSTRGVTVDLSNCSIGLNAGNVSSISRSIGGGWCYVETVGIRTDICGGCKNLVWDFYLVPTATSPANTVWTSTGTETVFAWGAQQNIATTAPSDYLVTTASSATLGPTCPLGYSQSLIDPSRCFLVSPITSRTFRKW